MINFVCQRMDDGYSMSRLRDSLQSFIIFFIDIKSRFFSKKSKIHIFKDEETF